MRYVCAGTIVALLLVGQAQAELQTEVVEYRAGEVKLQGYLAYDDATEGPRPGVLVVHEWWGHNAYARQRAEMLAGLGYTALAVDMYGEGKQAEHPDDAKAFMQAVIQDMSVAERRFEAAREHLAAQPSVDKTRIAALGYCFGGGMVLHMARSGQDLAGVVSYHGSLGTEQPAKKGQVKAQVLVFNGAADPFVPSEQVQAFEQEMQQAGASYRVVNYPGVKHSFTNPAADDYAKRFNMPLAYDAQADADAWEQTRRFLQDVFKQ